MNNHISTIFYISLTGRRYLLVKSTKKFMYFIQYFDGNKNYKNLCQCGINLITEFTSELINFHHTFSLDINVI